MTKGKRSLHHESPGPLQLFQDLHESTLNSSLAEILANLDSTSAPANRKGACDTDDEEFFSSSLQDFLQDDPQSPVHAAPNEPIHRSVLRELSFSASLKGFLVNREPTNNAEGKSAGHCSPTSEASSSSEAKERPDLVDGSVNLMHGSSNDLSQDLSSLEDSVNDNQDAETIGEVVDCDNVQNNEVDQPIDHEAIIASIELCTHSIEQRLLELAGSDALGTNDQKSAVGKAAQVTNKSLECKSPRSKQKAKAPSEEILMRSSDKTLTKEEDAKDKGPPKMGETTVASDSLDPAKSRQTTPCQTEPALNDVNAALIETVVDLIDDVQPVTATSSLINGNTSNPREHSPERLVTCTNIGNDVALIKSPKATKRREDDGNRKTIDKVDDIKPINSMKPASNTHLELNCKSHTNSNDTPSGIRKARKAKYSVEESPKRLRKRGAKTSCDEPENEGHRATEPTSSEIKELATERKELMPERREPDVSPPIDPSPKVSGEAKIEIEAKPMDKKQIVAREIEVDEAPRSPRRDSVGTIGFSTGPPTPKSPKSPRRELRLKIDLEEVGPPGEEGRQSLSDAPDESLPHVLKMLLEGVARKIRKHARQDSSRKFRSPKESEEQSPPVIMESREVSTEKSTPLTSPKQRIKVRVDKGSTSVSSPRTDRRRMTDPESLDDFDPHHVSGTVVTRDRSDQPTTPKRKERRSAGIRSTSSKQVSPTKKVHRKKIPSSDLQDWNPQAGPSGERVTGRRVRRRNPDDEERRTRERSGTRKAKDEPQSSLEKHRRSRSSGSKSNNTKERDNRRDDHSPPSRVVDGTDMKRRSSIGSGASPRSTNRRTNKESNVSLAAAFEEAERKSHHARSISSKSDHRSRHSGSRSVYSHDSRRRRDNQTSLSSTLDSNVQHRSTHSSSRSVSSRGSRHQLAERRNSATSAPSRRNSRQSVSMDQPTIEYDFSDDLPTGYRHPVADGRGRSGRHNASVGGRSQSDRHLLRQEREFDNSMRGRSQSQRHLPRVEQDVEFHPESKAPTTRSSSQPARSSRHHRSESSRSISAERSGRSRSRPPSEGRRRSISSSASNGNSKSNERSRSRPPVDERTRSNGSTASDRTPLRSGGRAQSPNRNPHPSTVGVGQVGPTTGKSKVQRALSFRDLFAREPDPWQEFASPVKAPRGSIGTVTTGSSKMKNMRFLPGLGPVRPASCRDFSAPERAPDQFEPFAHFTSQLELQTNGAAMDYPARISPDRKTTFYEPRSRPGSGWAPKLFR